MDREILHKGRECTELSISGESRTAINLNRSILKLPVQGSVWFGERGERLNRNPELIVPIVRHRIPLVFFFSRGQISFVGVRDY